MRKVNETAEKIVESMAEWGDGVSNSVVKKSGWIFKAGLVLLVAVGVGLLFFLYRFIAGLLRKK